MSSRSFKYLLREDESYQYCPVTPFRDVILCLIFTPFPFTAPNKKLQWPLQKQCRSDRALESKSTISLRLPSLPPNQLELWSTEYHAEKYILAEIYWLWVGELKSYVLILRDCRDSSYRLNTSIRGAAWSMSSQTRPQQSPLSLRLR